MLKFDIPMEVGKVYIATENFKDSKYTYDGCDVYSRGKQMQKEKVLSLGSMGQFMKFMDDLGLIEKPQYATYGEAKEHMINGNEAMFREEHGDLICRIKQGAIGYGSDCFVPLDMGLMYFSENWVLL